MLFHEQPWMRALVSPPVVFGLPIVWVFGVYTLANYMTSEKAFQMKRWMQAYNVGQILLCSYMVYGLMPCISLPNLFGINSEYDQRGEWFVFVHYLSKYFDWLDTLWILLRKNRKQLSFLHVYHHMTIPMVWGYLLYMGVGAGTTRYGAWINSLTHVFMYTHYLWTSFGLRNPFKKYITGWQILQFYSCLAHACLVRAVEETESWKWAWLQICYQISMVYLFSLRMDWVPKCTPSFSEEPKEDNDVRRRYTLIRGQVYDLTDFKHPGGMHMIDLAVGRDATVMFESAHIRASRADKALEAVPTGPSMEELEKAGVVFDRPNENWSTPAQSQLYKDLQKRITEEVLQPLGKASCPDGARGVPAWHYLSVIAGWLSGAALFVKYPGVLTGAWMGLMLCWVGLAIQHTSNHGGLTKDTRLGYFLGLLNDVGPGGSSIVWRYHHQVSHHAYCNDLVLDQDVHSSFPILRLDKAQKLASHHQWQWLYGPMLFCGLSFSIHLQDLECLLSSRTFLVRMNGTSAPEILLALTLKALHISWLYVLPAYIHGVRTMLLPWFVTLSFGSFWLSALFIVSHNLVEAKKAEEPVRDEKGSYDWARYQIETSSSWGGVIGSFLTGGLNLQIEHHLFPCMAHNLYPQVQTIVKDECKKRGITYIGYDYFLPNFVDHIKFLYVAGRAGWPESSKSD
eukprot:TRINITY_DN77963_c0_g1_i1.p1 TRINITY_DN77963_c0_g1~~TRINITY_DN77963_c0_g1_i1.p1  ORF type:complete len:688 (+),score=126.10 TRINITY_DN77963_c0_g1_i1:23-2065(+)